jgi:hypothetical protein
LDHLKDESLVSFNVETGIRIGFFCLNGGFLLEGILEICQQEFLDFNSVIC